MQPLPAAPAPSALPSRLAFAGFEADLAASTLSCRGRPITLRRQTWQLLCALLARPGGLCTTDELRALLWPRAVVGPDSLVQCVVELRRALGDGEHRLIRTVARRGYRLEADVVPASAAVHDIEALGPAWADLAQVRGWQDVARARAQFEAAAEDAAWRGEALAGVAMSHVIDLLNRWAPAPAWSRLLAREAADEALALAPGSARACHARAHVAHIEGRHVEAMLGFKAALRLAPGMSRAMLRLGVIEIELGHPERSGGHVQQALALCGDDPAAQAQGWFIAGMAQFHLGSDEAAARSMAQALRLWPASPFAHQWLAALRALAGDAPAAARHLAAFEALVPGHSIASLRETERSHLPAFTAPRARLYQGLARAGMA